MDAGDDARAIAWLAYVPVPGIGLVQAFLRPRDHLARYHAWQGTSLTLTFLLVMLVVGLLGLLITNKGAQAALGFVSGLVLLVAVGQMVWGGVGAALGRYPRLRPAWDLAGALRRKG